MRVADYRVEVERLSEADGGGFLAWVPDFPGCSSDGETQEEAINNVRRAIVEWVEEAIRLGRQVPNPTKGAAYAH